MSYTISIIEDLHNNIKVNFDIEGNRYLVGIYNTETKIYTHKDFDDIQEAYNIFETLSNYIIFGLCSEEQRRHFLLNA